MTTPQHVQISRHFEQRSERDLRLLLNQICVSHARNRTRFHDRGIVLFQEGDPVRGVYVLKKGSATVSVSSERTRSVLSPQTASARLANLLLEFGRESHANSKGVHTRRDCANDRLVARNGHTIANDFKKAQHLQITTDSVVIYDRGALENMLESKDEIESVLRDMSRKG